MSTAVVADCHLGGPGGACEPFVEQLAELPERGCRRLVLLGDVFHVWVGRKSFETLGVRRTAEAFQRLRGSGVRLDYIEGNRDFFIAGGPYASLFDSVGTELAFEAAGVRYLAVHGDGLNDRDRQYLLWRGLSMSWPVRLAITALPPRLARRIMHSVEGRLSKTNFKHKMRIPEEVLRSYAARRLGDGYDVLLLGHFHEPRSWRVEGGEVRIVDAWFNRHHVEWLG